MNKDHTAVSRPAGVFVKETGTYPIIIHAPGYSQGFFYLKSEEWHHRQNPLWASIVKLAIRARPSTSADTGLKDLTVVTINSTNKPGILEESLRSLGVTPFLIPYIESEKAWRNRYKIDLFARYLPEISTPYTLYVDAFDVLFLDHPSIALQRFRQMNTRMLLNAQNHFYPDCTGMLKSDSPFITDKWKAFERSCYSGSFCYLNAGAWIADTSYAAKFFSDCRKYDVADLIKTGQLPEFLPNHFQKVEDSEQLVVHRAFHDRYPEVELDARNEVFFCTVSVPHDFSQVTFSRTLRDYTMSDLKAVLRMFRNKRIEAASAVRSFLKRDKSTGSK